MKLRNLFQLALLATVIMFTSPSCVKEGPMGASGTDGTNGTDGKDGTASCLACHSGTNIEKKKAEFYMSEHSLGAIAVDYAGGRVGCSQCHSSEGFIQYATLGVANTVVNKPSAWECSTCHGIHQTFQSTDYALRLAGPVKSNADATYNFDFKNSSNLCVNCHQTRIPEPNKEKPGTDFQIKSTHYGPHHGPQGNVVAGVGFAELPGSIAYPTPGTSKHFTPSCTGCHMASSTNTKEGGHSLVPSLDACNTCHGVAEKDYNHNGNQTDILTKLNLLRDKLVALGVVTATPDVTNSELIIYAPKVGKIPMLQAQAVYNYFGMAEDRSEGVHNPVYVNALLVNTLEALNKK